MSKYISGLSHAGLLNSHSEDYGVFATAAGRRHPIAFCTSNSCCHTTKKIPRKNKEGGFDMIDRNYIRKEVQKFVPKTTENCLDCGSSLVWRME